MRAMVVGDEGRLSWQERAQPEPQAGEVRVAVRACGVNRADLLQRRGAYPAPPDAPADVLGLEYAGVVEAVGAGVRERKVGDRVFGLVGGGAYAEQLVVAARATAALPDGVPFVEAAAMPEAYLTAYDAMVSQAGLGAGDRLLVHAAASGVGTAAVRLGVALGAEVFGTTRSEAKTAAVRALGAAEVLTVRDARFADALLERLGARRIDVVLELLGGDYLVDDVRVLATSGRIVLVGLLAGRKVELDLGQLLQRRARVLGTVLRARPLEEKIALHQLLERRIVPLWQQGKLAPQLERVWPIEEVEPAHQHMQSGASIGKLVLQIGIA